MSVVLWILQVVLAVAFLGAGAMKLARPRRRLVTSGMGWAEDVSDTGVKAVGALEVVGALGLVLPAALGIAVVLTPLAALGLTAVMAGGVAVHVRRGDPAAETVPAAVLGLLALVVAVLRFGPAAF